MAIKLTQAEANLLIDMLKKKVEEVYLAFPNVKGKLSFDVIGEKKSGLFTVNIDRKGINAQACTYQGRTKFSDIVLLRLDVNPSSIHVNPSNNGKIFGTHLHMYTEEYELSEAVAFDIGNADLFSVCFSFFEKFNIIDPPNLTYQYSLEDGEN